MKDFYMRIAHLAFLFCSLGTRLLHAEGIKYKLSLSGLANGLANPTSLKLKSTNHVLTILGDRLLRDLFLVSHNFSGKLQEDAKQFSKLSDNIESWFNCTDTIDLFHFVPDVTFSAEKCIEKNISVGINFGFAQGKSFEIQESVYNDSDTQTLKAFGNVYKNLRNIMHRYKLDDVETGIINQLDDKQRKNCKTVIKFKKAMYDKSVWASCPSLAGVIKPGTKKMTHTITLNPLISAGSYISYTDHDLLTIQLGIKYITQSMEIISSYEEANEVITPPRSHGYAVELKLETKLLGKSPIRASGAIVFGQWLTHKTITTKENIHVLAYEQDSNFFAILLGLCVELN